MIAQLQQRLRLSGSGVWLAATANQRYATKHAARMAAQRTLRVGASPVFLWTIAQR